MSLRFLSALSLSTLVLASCKPTQTSQLEDAEDYVDPVSIEALRCDKGDAAYFRLADSGKSATLDEFPLLSGAEEIVSSTKDYVTRLDVCIDGEEIEIKRIVKGYSETPTVVIPTGTIHAEGLSEAIFEQDYSKLNVKVPVTRLKKFGNWEESKEVFYLFGSKDGTFAGATFAYDNEGSFEFAGFSNSGRFLNPYQYGVLEYQDPSVSQSCDTIANAKGRFTLGTVTFSWLGQHRSGTSGGAAPALCRVTIVDTAPELGEDAGKAFVIESKLGEQTETIQYTSNHHSVCDSFVFKTSKATYGFTGDAVGFGGGQCPKALQGAPEGTERGTNFLFQYGEETVAGNQADCSHPTRNCASGSLTEQNGEGDSGFGILPVPENGGGFGIGIVN